MKKDDLMKKLNEVASEIEANIRADAEKQAEHVIGSLLSKYKEWDGTCKYPFVSVQYFDTVQRDAVADILSNYSQLVVQKNDTLCLIVSFDIKKLKGVSNV